MNAIQSMRRELHRTQALMGECESVSGYILSSKRYVYQDLVRKAAELRESIEWLERLKEPQSSPYSSPAMAGA